MGVRIDQWLWAARIFKTRSKAAEACRNGKVAIAGINVKPSRLVSVEEVIQAKQKPITRLYRIKDLAVKRVSAKLAVNLVEEITPAEELEKLKLFYKDPLSIIFANREKGAGRPTKKDRRELEKLKGESK